MDKLDDPALVRSVAAFASELVRIDSQSFVSNIDIAARVEAELAGFEVERLDYVDPAGVPKRALVAARGSGGLALAAHMDTVPAMEWREDPWSGRVDGDALHGLGSTDMKGPLAAIIMAALSLPPSIPIALLISTDEETTKEGARRIADNSALARRARPKGIVVAEPTGMRPVRGHRGNVGFTAVAHGVQAHSSTGRGRNANWALIPFLAEAKTLFERLRSDPALMDFAYDPPFSDFNVVVDNHGAAVNVTAPIATARLKYRYSASVDPEPVVAAVQAAAERAGLELAVVRDGGPTELPEDHPFVRLCAAAAGADPCTAPYGTDASELKRIAPCVVLGPGDIAQAHTPTENASTRALAGSIPVFMRLATAMAVQG